MNFSRVVPGYGDGNTESFKSDALVIGAGPAGLMAAEVLAAEGHSVQVMDAMASVGRKFLLAGKGGLNLTHSEPQTAFQGRYRQASDALAPMLARFGPPQVRAWAESLGVDTYVGTSGRVFPVDMKAAPLLRALVHRLRHPTQGRPVHIQTRHRWIGCSEAGEWLFRTPAGLKPVAARCVVLALGGASWPQLGSDGRWVDVLARSGVAQAPLLPSNCGFDVVAGWSAHFEQRFAGHALKGVVLRVFADEDGGSSVCVFERKGECVVTQTGLEGSLVYAASADLRDAIQRRGQATLVLDLLPDLSPQRVRDAVQAPRGSRSLSSHLKSRLGLEGVKAGLLREVLGEEGMRDANRLAQGIKALAVRLARPRPVAEAISTAGGVSFAAVDSGLMLRQWSGVFCAGEMLDWEAPTGGYLLTACLSSGRWAGEAAARYLGQVDGARPAVLAPAIMAGFGSSGQPL